MLTSFDTGDVFVGLLVHADSAFEKYLSKFQEFLSLSTQTTIFLLILMLQLNRLLGYQSIWRYRGMSHLRNKGEIAIHLIWFACSGSLRR
jgi:hypothetical protein